MAQSRYQRDYYCTRCGNKTPRDKLTVKKAVFTDMGTKARTHKSRVTAHICPTCLVKDKDWQREAFAEPEFEAIPENMREETLGIPMELEPAHLLERAE
jgi:hypothetical protein